MRSFKLPALTPGVPHPVRVIAAGFNLLATQQPWAAERLARHAGKTIRVGMAGIALTLTIDGQGQLEQSDPAVVPDVVLEIDPEKFNLSGILDSNDRQDVAELVHITGQAALAQVVSDLARDLRPDPEDALAQLIGDLPARQIVQGITGFFNTLVRGSQSLARNTAEYLSEETDALLGRPAMQMFVSRRDRAIKRIDDLDARYAVLNARLLKLEQQKGLKA